MAKVLVEVNHELRGRPIFHLPKRGDDALRPRFNEGIDDVCNALFAHRPDAGIAGRQRYQIGIQRQSPNFAHLEESVIHRRRLRREDKSRAVREFGIGVSVQSKVDNVVLVERQTLEVGLGCVIAQQDGAWPGKIGGDGLYFVSAFRQSDQFLPLRPGQGPSDGSDQRSWWRLGCPPLPSPLLAVRRVLQIPALPEQKSAQCRASPNPAHTPPRSACRQSPRHTFHRADRPEYRTWPYQACGLWPRLVAQSPLASLRLAR